MKVFVTGVNGQLGHDVMAELKKRGYKGIGSDIADSYSGSDAIASMDYAKLDITDKETVNKVIGEIGPDAIVHCAAWTAVDLAEDDDKNELVHAINAGGTRNVAEAAKAVDAKMVYISTDYVFDGQGERPWEPDDKNYAP